VTNEVGDITTVGPLLDSIQSPLLSVTAAGADDAAPVYRDIAERQPHSSEEPGSEAGGRGQDPLAECRPPTQAAAGRALAARAMFCIAPQAYARSVNAQAASLAVSF
jgi:hypothetical protein